MAGWAKPQLAQKPSASISVAPQDTQPVDGASAVPSSGVPPDTSSRSLPQFSQKRSPARVSAPQSGQVLVASLSTTDSSVIGYTQVTGRTELALSTSATRCSALSDSLASDR